MINKSINWKYPEYIVQCEWLRDKINHNKIRIFDCTTYLRYCDDNPLKPYDVVSGFDDYKSSHIPGASFLDLQKDLSENKSLFRFTLPDLNILHKSFCKLGVDDEFHIILYSGNGPQWSTRIWWMLYILGFKKISILDGGFNQWKKLGYQTEKKINIFKEGNFKIHSNSFREMFVDKNNVLLGMKKKSCFLLNALTEDIHLGLNSRYGRPGRIPGSANVPFHELLDFLTTKFKSPEEVKKIFNKKGINYNDEIINYCGGGIAATLNAFLLYQLGFDKLKIYDNSMSEWAQDKNLPIEV